MRKYYIGDLTSWQRKVIVSLAIDHGIEVTRTMNHVEFNASEQEIKSLLDAIDNDASLDKKMIHRVVHAT